MVSMTAREVLTRAAVVDQAHRRASACLHQLDDLMKDVSLPNHRLNGLAQSVAWHKGRQLPAARLTALELELKRLGEKAEAGSDESELYAYLDALIGAGRSSRPDREAAFSRDHTLLYGETDAWIDQFDLLFAEEILEAVIRLARGKAVRDEVLNAGGEVTWR